MAENEQLAKSDHNLIDQLIKAAKATGMAVADAAHAVVEDKSLGAFASQGRDEIAMALKAFPDSVHTQSVGVDPYRSGMEEQPHGVTPLEKPEAAKPSIQPMEQETKGQAWSDRMGGGCGPTLGQAWADWVKQVREGLYGSNNEDQNERSKGRSLPQEEQEKKQEEEKERGRER